MGGGLAPDALLGIAERQPAAPATTAYATFVLGSEAEVEALAERVVRLATGLGPLDGLLADPAADPHTRARASVERAIVRLHMGHRRDDGRDHERGRVNAGEDAGGTA